MKSNGVEEHDPDRLEREVQHLRDECARLLHELELRYQKVAHVPTEVRARYRRLRATMVHLETRLAGLTGIVRWIVRERPAAVLAGALVAGAALVLVARAVVRQRRPPSLGQRVLGLLTG